MTAVSPYDGRLTSLIMPWVDTETMSRFLVHTAQTFLGDYCVMLLDSAGWHRAKDLCVPDTMALVPLLPYSPELNPVEHIWEYLRENSLRNAACGSLDEVVDLLSAGLKTLSEQPDNVHNMTCFDWINTLRLT